MSVLAPPMIEFDAAEHRYWHVVGQARRELVSVTRILKAAGYAGSGAHYTDAHRQRGTEAHEATQVVDAHPDDWERHLPFATLDRVGGYCESYRRFLGDHRVEWRLRERVVADVVLGVAGRLDAYGAIDGIGDAIVDFKTGADDPAYGPQTAAYHRMAPRFPLRPPIRPARFVLLLQADGTRARLVPKTDRSDYDAFLAAFHTYFWRQRHDRLR